MLGLSVKGWRTLLRQDDRQGTADLRRSKSQFYRTDLLTNRVIRSRVMPDRMCSYEFQVFERDEKK